MMPLKNDFDTSSIRGLSEAEVMQRISEDGYNELPSSDRHSIFSIILNVIVEPMFLLLLAGGVIYLILGDVEEAAMLLSFVLVVMGITIYQERKAERALEALRDLSSPRAFVIRDGEQKRIAGRDVVRGDILILSEGDRVPADAVLLWCTNFSIDESMLTGESAPVHKSAADKKIVIERPGGDDTPFVYSSTLVVQGQGIAEVKATGLNTEVGKIGKALQKAKHEQTRLQKETHNLIKKFAFVGISLCVLLVAFYYFTRGDLLRGLLAGITLAMSILPEEFPVVLTIFLALGAWRISQKNVLTRRIPAIETLGAATVLCVDKTGTLTLNRMTVDTIFANGRSTKVNYSEVDPMAETFHELIEFGILASQKDPFDPMEKAIKLLGEKKLSNTEHLHNNWSLVREYHLSKSLLALSHVWKSPDGKDYVIAAKGAPEAIADLCHFTKEQTEILSFNIGKMAKDGLRVLGVAKANFSVTELPHEQHDFNFEFVGLIGLADPVRPSVAGSIKECYCAGIRVVMITGDYPETARNIAAQIGLSPRTEIITGSELEKMQDEELKKRIGNVNIFARVLPEHKLRIVNALKANGEIVAMTGDGVNDAPALKSAHIGIAMGARGTDVAREASALVLLDDDFSSIVKAVRLGRRIFENIKKAIAYIFAVHVPIAGMSLIPVLFKWPMMLLPVHIVFLELIIDPACSIVFEAEAEEPDSMEKPPRDPKKPLFSKNVVELSILQGLSVLLVLSFIFVVILCKGYGELEARTMTFTTLILANLGLIFVNRSWSTTTLKTLRTPNAALWWVVGGTLFFLGMALYVPFLQGIFHFTPLHYIDLAICLFASMISLFWFEVFKIKSGKKTQSK